MSAGRIVCAGDPLFFPDVPMERFRIVPSVANGGASGWLLPGYSALCAKLSGITLRQVFSSAYGFEPGMRRLPVLKD
jgi:hypothetical protein